MTAPDARGRAVAAKDFRPLPEVTGTFRHTVGAGDRLDHLAYRYYGESLRYWHICDANPRFLSPLALLDQEPVTTSRFPLTAAAGEPPWGALVRALGQTVGVEEVGVIDEVVPVAAGTHVVDGEPVTVFVGGYTREVRVRHNRLTVTAGTLLSIIRAVGFDVAAPTDGGQLGQPIVIPAPVSG